MTARCTGGTDIPTVSVVIPTFNRAAYLGEAIQSVLDQTYTDYEIIVVDDGSTDNTAEVSAGYGGRVRYVRQEQKGAGAARNHGIRLAQGRYIAFLDSDDLFLPRKLEVQVLFMERNPAISLVYSAAYILNEEGCRLEVMYMPNCSTDPYLDLVCRMPLSSPIATPTVIVRADVLHEVGPFMEGSKMSEDIDLWRRIMRRNRVAGLLDTLSEVRRHTGNAPRHPEDVWNSVELYVERALADDPRIPARARRAALADVYGGYGKLSLNAARKCLFPERECRCVARKFLFKALRHAPLRTATWSMLIGTFISNRLRVRLIGDANWPEHPTELRYVVRHWTYLVRAGLKYVWRRTALHVTQGLWGRYKRLSKMARIAKRRRSRASAGKVVLASNRRNGAKT